MSTSTEVTNFPIGTCQVLNLAYKKVVKGPFTHIMFAPTLILPVNGPLKQLWRQGAPLPFSLTVVSTNKLTLTNKITIYATARLP